MQYKKVHGIFAEFCEDLLLGLGILFFLLLLFYFFLSFFFVCQALRTEEQD